MSDQFYVWCPEYGQDRSDARQVVAYDEEAAAEKWAEHQDQRSADYLIVSGSGVEVMVARLNGGGERFFVAGESVPSYHARKVKV